MGWFNRPVLLRVAVAHCALSSILGCGRSGVERASISGNVTLNGKPVGNGSIRFIPVGSGPSSGAVIADGRYEIVSAKGPVLGPHRVEISVPQKSGRRVAPPGVLARAQQIAENAQHRSDSGQPTDPNALNPTGLPETALLDEWIDAAPAKYNKESTLEVTIESGRITFDVNMESK